MPQAMASPTQGSCARGTRSRPVDVQVATANISSTNASDSHTLASAAAMNRDTSASCTTARRAAVGYSRWVPSRPMTAAATATTTSATSTTASLQSGETAAPPPAAAECTYFFFAARVRLPADP